VAAADTAAAAVVVVINSVWPKLISVKKLKKAPLQELFLCWHICVIYGICGPVQGIKQDLFPKTRMMNTDQIAHRCIHHS
jgi:hypothetical protein